MPGTIAPTDCMLRVVGSASSTSRATTCVFCALATSTSGVTPVTVTLSSIAPTRSSALIGTVTFDGSSTPSRTKVENPWSANVILYVPGRRSAIV